ncbi:MAG: hypothetical protein JOZ29_00165, partial [Deltaproteobacteria bacterium]|nr:hypothetical protein [Deltaproteobacteria bacterium]
MDYDPYDGIAAVSNGDEAPPFLTLISTRTFTVLKKTTFNGENGTPDATIGGIGSILFDSTTGKFLVSIPQLCSNLTAGAVAEMDPVSGKITKVFNGIDNCMAAGMAQGPGEKVLIGCDPGFPPPDPVAFAPRTYIINGRTGEILANIKEVGGADEVWYNPGDHRFHTGSRDFFISPTAKSATGIIGVIDADTNQWIENIKAGSNSHSVAANPRNNQIFVPLKDPNPLCGTLPG